MLLSQATRHVSCSHLSVIDIINKKVCDILVLLLSLSSTVQLFYFMAAFNT